MSNRASRITLAAAKLAAVGFAVSVGGWFVVHAQRSANPPEVERAPYAREIPQVAAQVPTGPPAIAEPVAAEQSTSGEDLGIPTFFVGTKSGVPLVVTQPGDEFDCLPAPPNDIPIMLPSSKSLAPGTLIPKRPPQQP